MSRMDFVLNFYIETKGFNIDHILDLINKHKISKGSYRIEYKDYKSEYKQSITKLKKAYKKGDASYFEGIIYLRKKSQLPGFPLNVSILENKEYYNVHMRISALSIDEVFKNPKYYREAPQWLMDLFKDIVMNIYCIYAYADFDECTNNKKMVSENNGTYRVVESTGYSFTPAIFNEINYFSKKILEQNNNREFILSKDLGKVIKLENGGIITIDKNTHFKELLKNE